MNIKNRTAIIITNKKPYIDWSNSLTPDFPMSVVAEIESTIYLVKSTYVSDELSIEKCLKKNYQEIFEEKLEGQWTDENDWPKDLTLETFKKWFGYQMCDLVIDLKK